MTNKETFILSTNSLKPVCIFIYDVEILKYDFIKFGEA